MSRPALGALLAALAVLDRTADALTVAQVSAGNAHTCAVLSDGALRCWGRNNYGQLGYGHNRTIGDDETPASAGDVPVGGAVAQVSAGVYRTCAVLTNSSLRCWGINTVGQLGYGHNRTIGDNETPASAGDVPVGGPVAQVSVGGGHTCALLVNGSVRCWGYGVMGVLGYAATSNVGDDETPASKGDVDVGGIVTQVAAGDGSTIALLANGRVRCWGTNVYGQLGYGNREMIGDNEPPRVAGDVNVGGLVKQVAVNFPTCALLVTGAVRCWGYGDQGNPGYGMRTNVGDDEPPAFMGDVNVGGNVSQVATGGFVCVLLVNGSVRCWGENVGQMGYGHSRNIGDNELPVTAGDLAFDGPVAQITVGSTHACAIMVSGPLRCWGWNAYGQLGYGNTAIIGDNETVAAAGDVEVFAAASPQPTPSTTPTPDPTTSPSASGSGSVTATSTSSLTSTASSTPTASCTATAAGTPTASSQPSASTTASVAPSSTASTAAGALGTGPSPPNPAPAITGGVLGGLVAVLAVGALIAVVRQRRRRRRPVARRSNPLLHSAHNPLDVTIVGPRAASDPAASAQAASSLDWPGRTGV
jgi:alpha-tubulin suppressor-like RCC1 family protein